jgi:eukaryotic-like serine/threonine-protein kinase
MGERTADENGDLPPTVAARSEDVCSFYMSAWQSGHRPRIEDALERCPPPYPEALLRNLLVLDLTRRRRDGEVPTPGEYRARFPEHAQLIDSLFRKLNVNPWADKCGTTPLSLSAVSENDLAQMGYVILGELGRGGMGVVYQAYDSRRDRQVALKTMQRPDPVSLLRFKQEFRSLADVAHPNLVALYDLISDGQFWFFTMEFVNGVDFLTYVRTPAVPDDARGENGHDPQTPGGPPRETPLADTEPYPGLTTPGTEADSRPSETPLADTEAYPSVTTALPEADGGRGRRVEPAGEHRLALPNIVRLRAALKQLAAGVAALHDAGKLHRDIKPSNVLVDSDGRVVLLDFGLAAELEQADLHQSSEPHVVGTVAYMAPEQAASLPVSPASDWYSVGVMLYQALTGQLPFVGRPLEILVDKQRMEPLAPRELAADIPEDLDTLCLELLRRDPDARPTGREVVRRLGDAPGEPHVAVSPRRLLRQATPLIGRQCHLQTLEAAFQSMSGGHTAAVYVHGRSGAGKTVLVQHFLSGLAAHDAAVVLTGRCYEQESVPYKALDSLVDSLCRHLKRLSAPLVQALLPRDIWPLTRVFPVLSRIEAVASAPRRATEVTDPRELRRRAVIALRELLARLGDRGPLVLAIDDLQWGDADSAALLSELMRPPDPPVFLLLGCYRDEDAGTSPFLRALFGAPEHENTIVDQRDLAVLALTESEASELALSLLGGADPDVKVHARAIARESGGNPFFVTELARHFSVGAELSAGRAAREVNLDEVLWDRIQRLPGEARRFLEVVAVSGQPVRQASVCRAAGLGTEAPASLAVLRQGHLVRGAGPDSLGDVEVYHDRIRETVIKHLSPEGLKTWHGELARVLEDTRGADPETLAVHFESAGNPEVAAKYYAEAAAKAAKALAFDRAATLYRHALELWPFPRESGRSLRVELGDALANAGRGVEAARTYQDAALRAEGLDVLQLQRRAAYQFLISGHIDEGLATFNQLLAQVGMRLSSTPRRAFLKLCSYRTLLLLRGLGFQRRDASEVPPEELLRIDIARSASLGFSLVDVIEGAAWQSQALIRALRGGERLRIALTMAWEAVHSASQGRTAAGRTAGLIQSADRLAQEIGHPHAIGMATLSAGCIEFLGGRFPPALELLDRAATILREQCAGVVWELDTAHIFGLWTLFSMGRQSELRRRFQLLSDEATQRGDRYLAATTGTRIESLAWLADDNVGEARARADLAVQHWSRHRFHLQHLNQLCAHLDIDLYAGDGAAGWRRLCMLRPALKASLLLRVQLLRIDILHSSGRCAVAAAAVADDPRAMLRAAEGYARQLDRQRVPWASAHVFSTRAGASMVRGDSVDARRQLIAAVEAFDAVSMGLYAAAARRHLGKLVGGDEGRDLIARADEWMIGQGIKNPARMAAGITPGFAGR